MVENNYLSIDLNDPRTKDIAEIMGNKTCKEILNLIAEKELTETEISQKLKLPINTVDYNIKKLIKSGLIESSTFWWSIKGKKMPSYKVSNKKIIISPKSFSSKILLLPALIIGGAVALVVRKLSFVNQSEVLATEDFSLKSIQASSRGSTAEILQSGFFSSLSGWEWFLIGAWFGAILLFILNYIFERR